MADELRTGVPSTMAINGHPIHPMLVPFPIGFLVGALATDLAFWGIGDPFWSRASLWLLAAGFVMGALAAVIGLIDFLTIERARTGSTGWVHFIGNAIALVLAAVNAYLRIGDHAAALPGGIVLSFIVVAILLVTGWMGGELAYRHKIGVFDGDATVRSAVPGSRAAYAGSKPNRPR
jgi:uncharacterized membrane protein